ncbi:geranylgeranyl diphosphate reductase [Sphingomonas sp. 32-62-10]|uniref:geranylgeranyl diphosphate reductase n=1 Tax=Sphingomonas sp. 32-62-10 TaxID=1970436 RepID=UPI0026B1F236
MMNQQRSHVDFDVVVVGGGPSGSVAATEARTASCGIVMPWRARNSRDQAPAARTTWSQATRDGFVGMVDRDVFDEWLRARAALTGAERRTGSFTRIDRDADGCAVVVYTERRGGEEHRVRARCVIGADGARSGVARQEIPGADRIPCVFAYHEIVKSPPASAAFNPSRCDVLYQGKYSPDFYAWVFPHGETTSIGVGSANKGYELRDAITRLRADNGMAACETVRTEGAPIPLKPLKRWDNGRDVLVAGDAAGVVAPASGEGIYYAMAAGRFAAEAVQDFLATGDARALKGARKQFMRAHGKVFWVLGIMQYFWYANDKRRERFVKICEDKDVQELTWQAYMNKELVRRKPMAHVRIFLKDMGHLLGIRGVAA